MKQSIQNLALTSMLFILISGCVTQQVKTPPPPTQEQVAQLKAAQSLENALALYEKGHYQQAESKLLSEDIWQGSKQTRISALKHLAFIYCITERKEMCRHAFERAVHIDQHFILSSAEATHPLWGPQYRLARSGVQD